jgi:peptidyl-prolyl cis-trans isomerase D
VRKYFLIILILFCSITAIFRLSSFCENGFVFSVNGDTLSKDEFNLAFKDYLQTNSKYYGGTMDDASREQLKKEFIDLTVDKMLYIQESRRRGITAKVYAGEEEIEELLIQDPNNYTDGKFDLKKYTDLSLESSHEMKSARDNAEKMLIHLKSIEIVPTKVIASIKDDITPDNSEALEEYARRIEKIRLKYIKIDPVAYANNMFVTEDEMKTYYKEHVDDFMRSGSKRYAVLYFDPDDFRDMVTITPQMINDHYRDNIDYYKTDKLVKVKYALFRIKEYSNRIYDLGVNIRKYYDDNKQDYVEPAEARIRIISIKKPCDMGKILKLEDEIMKNVPFNELAARYADDMSDTIGGDLGYIKKGSLKEPFNSVAFMLDNGETSGVIETENGYYVISVEEKKQQRAREFNEVRDEIEEMFTADASRPFALSDAKRFRVEAIKNGFVSAADKKNKTVYETDYFKPSDRIPAIGLNTIFTGTAFSLPLGAVSEVIEYDGGYLVLMVEGIKGSEIMPEADVEDEIKEKIYEENTGIFAENAAKHALNLISQGISMEGLEQRSNIRISYLDIPPTMEAPGDVGKIDKRDDGYYVTVFLGENKPYIPNLNEISKEVAAALALSRAEKMAKEKGKQLILSEALEKGSFEVTPYFSRDDYLINNEYMRPLIEQSFALGQGEAELIKNLNKYYVVSMLDRKTDGSGTENSAMMLQILREERDKYQKDWLKKEREKAEIHINI